MTMSLLFPCALLLDDGASSIAQELKNQTSVQPKDVTTMRTKHHGAKVSYS